MSFKGISIEDYTDRIIEKDPTRSRQKVEDTLILALGAHSLGHKCECGNDIWVLGSLIKENTCFTCITGETDTTGVLEIDKVLDVEEDLMIPFRDLDETTLKDMIPLGEGGYYNDDGTEIDISKIKIPELCLSCINYNNPFEEILCNLTRADQQDDEEFICYGYEKRPQD